MRHQKSGRKFGRKSAPRHAMFSNMVCSLIEHERIKTTDAKAKEIRKIAERQIGWATSVGNLVAAGDAGKEQDAVDKARIVHAMRMAQRVVKQRAVLDKLFHEIGPRMAGRAGGYTRIMKLGHRHGDAAPVSLLELVDRAAAPAAEEAPEVEAAPKGKKAKAPKAEAAEAAPKAAKAPKAATAPKAEAAPKAAKPKAKAKSKTEE